MFCSNRVHAIVSVDISHFCGRYGLASTNALVVVAGGDCGTGTDPGWGFASAVDAGPLAPSRSFSFGTTGNALGGIEKSR